MEFKVQGGSGSMDSAGSGGLISSSTGAGHRIQNRAWLLLFQAGVARFLVFFVWVDCLFVLIRKLQQLLFRSTMASIS